MSLLLQHPINSFEDKPLIASPNYKVQVRRKATTIEAKLKERILGVFWITESRFIADINQEKLIVQKVGRWKYEYNIPDEFIDYPKYANINGTLTRIK